MQIKQIPEDFRVEEVLEPRFSSRGQYAYFILTKKNWTTLKVIKFIADKLHISIKRFSFAGQKDRRAVTSQYVSVYEIKREQLICLNLKDIGIKFLGYADKPISLGGLTGNKFVITIRDITVPVRIPKFIPNYFDEQRFGGYRPNLHLVGRELLKGNYENAAKLFLCNPFPNETEDYRIPRRYLERNWEDWAGAIKLFPKQLIHERAILGFLAKGLDYAGAFKGLQRQLFTMLTQAYASYLFNQTLALYIKIHCNKIYEADYAVGKLVFAEDIEKLKDAKLPIVGYDTKIGDKEIKGIVDGILGTEGIEYKDFKVKGMPRLSLKNIERNAVVELKELKCSELEKDELNEGKFKQVIEFILQKGSYATVVFKAVKEANASR
ncbi:tRNA pseudouridine(13) synthase TruD [archaeon]|nr:tRNA pseudouridine(13) synthase TruD [archaeon]